EEGHDDADAGLHGACYRGVYPPIRAFRVNDDGPMTDRAPAARDRGARVRYWLRLAIGLLLTAALLGLLARRVDVDDVAAVLLGADGTWLAIGLLLYVLLQAIRAVRFKLLAPQASMRLLLGVHAVHA